MRRRLRFATALAAIALGCEGSGQSGDGLVVRQERIDGRCTPVAGSPGVQRPGSPASQPAVAVHAPMPHVTSGSSSSATPSQSSSWPLQTSTPGVTWPMHSLLASPLQNRTPARHTPTPGVPASPS